VNPLLDTERTDLVPGVFVARHAEIFAMFDAATQDSGNVSYMRKFGLNLTETWPTWCPSPKREHKHDGPKKSDLSQAQPRGKVALGLRGSPR
jgi:hypothetical protein